MAPANATRYICPGLYTQSSELVLPMRGANIGGNGGAVLNRGDLTLGDVLVTGNSAMFDAGISNNVGNSARLTLNAGTEVTGNTATAFGGGIINTNESVTTLNTGSRVTGNTAPQGVDIQNFGTVVVQGGDAGNCNNVAPGTGCSA